MALTKQHAEVIQAAARLRFAAGELTDALAAIEREPRSNAKKLTEDEVFRIRQWYGHGGVSQREIADAYDVNRATVSRIVRGIYHRG
ncbi:helix-turn-helix domain-containing protein [Amycolatopsis sp. NPDC003731]